MVEKVASLVFAGLQWVLEFLGALADVVLIFVYVGTVCFEARTIAQRLYLYGLARAIEPGGWLFWVLLLVNLGLWWLLRFKAPFPSVDVRRTLWMARIAMIVIIVLSFFNILFTIYDLLLPPYVYPPPGVPTPEPFLVP